MQHRSSYLALYFVNLISLQVEELFFTLCQQKIIIIIMLSLRVFCTEIDRFHTCASLVIARQEISSR